MGVDACKKGWIGLTSDARAYFGATIAELAAESERDGMLSVIAIDIPIGLSPDGPRRADLEIASLIGKRRSSVFQTPIREALHARTHADATALNVRATGKGISQQAYGLRTKILDVDDWIATAEVAGSGLAVIEVHPELSFATIARRPLAHPKSTWTGSEERRALLGAGRVRIPSDLGTAGEKAAVDDVLDAGAALWTAMRFRVGLARSFPSLPERFIDGTTAAIWA